MRMKKIQLFIVFLFLALVCLSTASASVRIVPFSGASNVFLGSPYYQGLSEGGTLKWIGHDKENYFPAKGEYTDDNMIALIGVNDTSKSGSVTVTAICPNGFDFVSQSNPSFKRPFEIALVYKQADVGYEGDDYGPEYFVLSPTNSEKSFDVKGKNAWFDVVLVLPGTDNNSGITIDGINYPLAQADDYSAVVTLKVKYGTEEQLVTIPFSGYYKNESGWGLSSGSSMSISINTTSAASNLNIGKMAGGTPIHVATIDLMIQRGVVALSDFDPSWWTKYDLEKYIVNYLLGKVKMFFSSSNDPTVQYERGFELVHSSVGEMEIPKKYNSIGFRITTTSYDSQSYEIQEYNNIRTSKKDVHKSYYGDEYYDVSGKELQGGDGSGFIWPLVVGAYPRKDYSDSREGSFYYTWEGDVWLELDSLPSETMLAGLYDGKVYFHVIDEGA